METPDTHVDTHTDAQSPRECSPHEVGLCRHDDPDDWFAVHKVHIAQRVRICFNCPAQTQCARNALDFGATDGVWAGVYLPGRQFEPQRLIEARDRLGIVAAQEFTAQEHQRRMGFTISIDALAASMPSRNPLTPEVQHSPSQVKYSA